MYHNQKINELFKVLKTKQSGLSGREVKSRLKHYGYNELKKQKHFSVIKAFLSQFTDPMIIILMTASLIAFLILKELTDPIIILAIVFLNAIFGFVQEYKAEKSIELLRKLSSPKVRVLRDNKEIIIDSKFLVPGDIIFIEAGDKIPADCRLIKVSNLQLDESTLTGESTSVEKVIAVLPQKTSLAERKNMIFKGTTLTQGTALALVVATGMNTQLGKIASMVETVDSTKIPIRRKLATLGKHLTYLILGIVIIITLLGILESRGLFNMFMTGLSLAVAAIPEGLPAVLTISLALGVRRMVKKNTLTKKMHAVEGLGEVTVICADKTGTMTRNEMEVQQLFLDNKSISVNKTSTNKDLFVKILSSCNHASLPEIGDPTELALLKIDKKIKREEIIDEIPFDSKRKYMITYHKINGKKFTFSKFAPEKIIELCSYIKIDNKIEKLTNQKIKKILEQNDRFASQGLRVLGAAYSPDFKSKNLIFIGLVAMEDPPRKEVKKAIKLCKQAGIRVIMITGDHKLTATSIAKEIGISATAITGQELDNISDKKLQQIVKITSIFARVTPEHKVRILQALQQNGEIVAMTGDGVNDAPALKKADVGVAMSIKGTDISRDAADIVLLDDNFASIVTAVEEGRTIYDNIKKAVKFLLSGNIDEVLVILLSILFFLPLPLLPIQILWINLVTDSLPALALTNDPSHKNVMKRNPRNPKEWLLKDTIQFIITAGIIGTVITMLLFLTYYNTDLVKARTLALTALIIFEAFLVFSARFEKTSINKNIFENRFVIYAVIISIIIHSLILYTPLNNLFQVSPLLFFDWAKIIGLCFLGFLLIEASKYIKISKFKLN